MARHSSAARCKVPDTVYEAVVKEPDVRASAADPAMLTKIQHMFDRADHKNANEQEAQVCMYLAQKLMDQHNITRADVLANTSQEERSQLGELIVVQRIRRDGNMSKRVLNERYIGPLARAMEIFFVVKSYTKSRWVSLDVCFVGISTNTLVAANSFARIHNILMRRKKDFSGITSQNSYCLGLCDGLIRMAKHEKQLLKDKAAEQERIKAEPSHDNTAGDRDVFVKSEIKREPHSGHADTIKEDTGSDDDADCDMTMLDGDDDAESCDESDDGDSDANILIKTEPEAYDGKILIKSEPDDGGKVSIKPEPKDDECKVSIKSEPKDDGDYSLSNIKKKLPEGIDLIDLTMDVDEAIDVLVKKENCSADGNHQVHDRNIHPGGTEQLDRSLFEGREYASGMALAKFEKDAMEIADDVLKQRGIKLKKGRKLGKAKHDSAAYKTGFHDAASVDVRGQKKLKDEPSWGN